MMTISSISIRINIALAVFFVCMHVFVLVLVPVFLLPLSVWWGLSVLLPVAVTTCYWALIHEAFHGHLLNHKGTNRLIGRVLCVLFGAPYDLLRFGHLMHHRYNRSKLDRSEIIDSVSKPLWWIRVRYFYRLLIGLYIAELLSNLLVMFPRPWLLALIQRQLPSEPAFRSVQVLIEQRLLTQSGLRALRLDSLLVATFYGCAVWFYGACWWLLLLLLLGRGFLISFYDNAYHYGTAEDELLAAYNLRCQRLVSRLILNFNYHRVHHQFPNLPWMALPERFTELNEQFDGEYWATAMHQFRGPILTHTTTS